MSPSLLLNESFHFLLQKSEQDEQLQGRQQQVEEEEDASERITLTRTVNSEKDPTVTYIYPQKGFDAGEGFCEQLVDQPKQEERFFTDYPRSVLFIYLNIFLVVAAEISTVAVYVPYFNQLGWTTDFNVLYYSLISLLTPLSEVVLGPIFGFWQGRRSSTEVFLFDIVLSSFGYFTMGLIDLNRVCCLYFDAPVSLLCHHSFLTCLSPLFLYLFLCFVHLLSLAFNSGSS